MPGIHADIDVCGQLLGRREVPEAVREIQAMVEARLDR